MNDRIKQIFKDWIATYCDYGNIAVLTLAKPGSIPFGMHYVFDKKGHTMTISGDLGYAVVRPTCKVDLENCAKAFQCIDYFAEKIRASSHYYFVYDEKKARKELSERLMREDLTEEEKESRQDLIDRIMEDYNPARIGIQILNDKTSNDLARIDPDSSEWIGTLGRRYHQRIYWWMYGLQMAWEQVAKKSQPEIHVTLGMSTAHICADTRKYLDTCCFAFGGSLPVFRKADDINDYGWWVPCFEEPEEDMPEDLGRCIQFAQQRGACWIMFDNDATVYEELLDEEYNDFVQKNAEEGG